MDFKKNKGLVFIIVSIVVVIPNLGCLVMANFGMNSAPLILFIVPTVMIFLSIIGFAYGILLKNRSK